MSTEPITPKGQELRHALEFIADPDLYDLAEAEMRIREIIAQEIEEAIIRATVVPTTPPELGMFSERIEDISATQAFLGAANVVRGRVPLTEEQALAQYQETSNRRTLLALTFTSRAESEVGER